MPHYYALTVWLYVADPTTSMPGVYTKLLNPSNLCFELCLRNMLAEISVASDSPATTV